MGAAFFENQYFRKFAQITKVEPGLNVDVHIAMVGALIQQEMDLVDQIVMLLKEGICSAEDAWQWSAAVMSQNSALRARRSGQADWARCSPARLQCRVIVTPLLFGLENIINLHCRTQEPIL